jgi:hypothetical protein
MPIFSVIATTFPKVLRSELFPQSSQEDRDQNPQLHDVGIQNWIDLESGVSDHRCSTA